jgi:hypothetical protein
MKNAKDTFMTRKMAGSSVILSICALALAGLSTVLWSPRISYAAVKGVLLTGTIKSASNETMGGVTVSAKIEGQTITTSVFTDEQGHYYFPAMQFGNYRVCSRGGRSEGHRSAQRFCDETDQGLFPAAVRGPDGSGLARGHSQPSSDERRIRTQLHIMP